MTYKNLSLLFALGLLTLFACSDPALIGSEILAEDQANLEFTDQVAITGETVLGSPVQTHSPFISLQLTQHLVGKYEDPLFGTSEASIYSQVSLGSQDRPNLQLPRFDSMVLSLAYDTLGGGYGDLSQAFGLEVFRLGEDLVSIDDYFSNDAFNVNRTPLGSVEFTAAPEEQVLIKDYTNDEPIDTLVDAHIRIPLSTEFGIQFLQDTTLYGSNDNLQEFFKGIYIRPTIASPGMLSLDFASNLSRISLYYSTGRNEGEQQHEYRFDFNQGNARFVNLSHNYEGTVVGTALRNDTDSLLFVQGMTGVNTQLTFPDLTALEGVVVNKAELELTVASFEGNNTEIYPPSEQIVVTNQENNERDVIVDVRSALFAQNPINPDVFGGVPMLEMENGVTLTRYRINISGHFQDIINGTKDNSITLTSGIEQTNLYFQIPPKASDASRVVFYGPNHAQFPLKLNLTYTRL